MSLSRRRFVASTAGTILGAVNARFVWSAQSRTGAGADVPGWLSNAKALRNLSRLLELASVPGLSLGVIENGRVWTRGFGQAVEDPAQEASSETVFEAASLGKPLFAYAV